ncbi:PAS domain-containing sensor histidine kinase [Catalinimonas niigatensis]|uniref:PAS domain-containing sensor histidine kinase n=1 Tax=Catalinimonas niigatensis TaxID=1397264 RepID=UPI0026661349|nr:PAS domain S-box protein [Catalinimonas niigatensis]WPP50948.1 PAS domain S-box protein [Catalinimonas niigatensis]
MTPFQQFSSYVLAHQLDTIATHYLSRARDTKLGLLSLFEHLSEEQIHEVIEKNFRQLLESIIEGTAYEHAIASITLWAENKFPGIQSNDPGLHDLIQVIGIRKYSFIKVLPEFTQDLEVYTSIILEMNEYYDFYREKVYETYINIQHQKLQEEKDFIELVMDTTTEGISALDTELRVTLWNKALTERSGIKKEDIVGKPLFDFFPKNKTVLEMEAIEKAQKGEKVYLQDIPIKARQGFYDMHVVPLKDASGRIAGSLSLSRDVTERKLLIDKMQETNEELQSTNTHLEEKIQELRQTQNALEESHNFIKSVTDTSPDFITVYNLKERKNIYANRQVAGFLGYEEEEAREGGFTFLSTIMHPDDIPVIKTFIQEYLIYEGDTPRELEYRVKSAQGDYRWIRASYNVFRRDENGFPIEVVSISKDITLVKRQEQQLQSSNEELEAALEELKSAEEQLLEANAELENRVQERTKELVASEEELRQLLDKSVELNDALADKEQQMRLITDALPVLISYVDVNETYVFVNEAYTRWFKKSKEEIIGSKSKDILGEQAYQEIKGVVKKVLSGEEISYEGRMTYQTAGTKDVISTFIPHQVNGTVVGFFALVTDISSLKQVQEEILHKNAELTRINTDLDNFIYTASHDLKSPIVNLEGIILALSDTIMEKLDDTELKLFKMMGLSIEKLKDTISYLGDVTRISKNLEDKKEMISIAQVMTDVKGDISHLIEEMQPAFEEEYHIEQIKFSRANFKSIVYNLVSNAVKYRSFDRPLKVSIKSYVQDQYVVLAVQDNGLGLSSSQQLKLFKMFRRLHTHVEGTGIGLYIVKRIIENSGGRIEVQSKEKEGSTFFVYFPKNE